MYHRWSHNSACALPLGSNRSIVCNTLDVVVPTFRSPRPPATSITSLVSKNGSVVALLVLPVLIVDIVVYRTTATPNPVSAMDKEYTDGFEKEYEESKHHQSNPPLSSVTTATSSATHCIEFGEQSIDRYHSFDRGKFVGLLTQL